jgi:hypothetical protein
MHIVVTYLTLVTDSMELSPSREAATYAATQDLPRILRNPKVHYCGHKSPPLVPILSQTNLVSPRSNLILCTHPRLGLPSGLIPSGFPTNSLHAFLFFPIHATYPAHFTLLTCPFYFCLVSSTSHEAPHYATFSYFLSPHPSSVQYSSEHPVLKHPQSVFLL